MVGRLTRARRAMSVSVTRFTPTASTLAAAASSIRSSTEPPLRIDNFCNTVTYVGTGEPPVTPDEMERLGGSGRGQTPVGRHPVPAQRGAGGGGAAHPGPLPRPGAVAAVGALRRRP